MENESTLEFVPELKSFVKSSRKRVLIPLVSMLILPILPSEDIGLFLIVLLFIGAVVVVYIILVFRFSKGRMTIHIDSNSLHMNPESPRKSVRIIWAEVTQLQSFGGGAFMLKTPTARCTVAPHLYPNQDELLEALDYYLPVNLSIPSDISFVVK